jgi:5-methylthioribose kinase
LDATLSAADVPAYLVRRGIFESADRLEVAELSGGVSAAVFAVRGARRRVVLKQALERFKVADEWIVPPERAVAEAEALELMARLLPGSVPALLDLDRNAFVLVVEEAPPTWRPWKALLLEGVADPAVARRLGELAAALHNDSTDTDLGSRASFEAQRVDPYLRTVERRHPELAAAVGGYVERLLSTELCVVHGDYSPKNVLVGENGTWVIDWEIVHRGDPTFDLAFMLNHLALKAIHRPSAAAAYRACAEAFVDAYGRVPAEPEYLLGLGGCLMVARVDGKSPAEYLTPEGRERARACGTSLLLDPPTSIAEAWARLGPPSPPA